MAPLPGLQLHCSYNVITRPARRYIWGNKGCYRCIGWVLLWVLCLLGQEKHLLLPSVKRRILHRDPFSFFSLFFYLWRIGQVNVFNFHWSTPGLHEFLNVVCHARMGFNPFIESISGACIVNKQAILILSIPPLIIIIIVIRGGCSGQSTIGHWGGERARVLQVENDRKNLWMRRNLSRSAFHSN